MGLAVTSRQFWLLFHLGLGALYIHSFVEGVRGLLHPERSRRLLYGAVTMTVVAWLTVITGTWLVYPGYRAKPTDGADLVTYPQRYLLADEATEGWHEFGMEWKEHAGWLAPFLTTAVAFVAMQYTERLGEDKQMRRLLLGLFATAFVVTLVAGTLGAFINKVAPNLFLNLS